MIPDQLTQILFRLGRFALLCADICQVHFCHIKLIINHQGFPVGCFSLTIFPGIGVHDAQVEQASRKVSIIEVYLPVLIKSSPSGLSGSRTQLLLPHL